jgi:hypothetical protein
MVAPSAVTLQSLERVEGVGETRGPSGAVSTGQIASPQRIAPSSVAESFTPASKTVAPMVRALARSQSPVEPLIERPLSGRLPVASRPVQTRSGLFAPERLVLTPDVDPVEVTADAIPAVAERVARRNTAASHAATRTEASFVSRESAESPVLGQPRGSAGSLVEADAERRSRTTENTAAPQRTRRHRIVRTASGSYAPESVVLAAQEGGPSETTGVADTVPAQRRVEKSIVSRTEERLETLAALKPRGTTHRSRPQAIETSVLVPAPKSGEDSPPGLHAASRARKNPVVGYTAAKAIRSFQQELPQQRSHLAPRRSLNPVRHARITRKHRLSTDKNAVTITLPSQPVGLGEDTGKGTVPTVDRRALATEIRTARESREYSARPLDWSNARIEVMQVPAQPRTNASE